MSAHRTQITEFKAGVSQHYESLYGDLLDIVIRVR